MVTNHEQHIIEERGEFIRVFSLGNLEEMPALPGTEYIAYPWAFECFDEPAVDYDVVDIEICYVRFAREWWVYPMTADVTGENHGIPHQAAQAIPAWSRADAEHIAEALRGVFRLGKGGKA